MFQRGRSRERRRSVWPRVRFREQVRCSAVVRGRQAGLHQIRLGGAAARRRCSGVVHAGRSSFWALSGQGPRRGQQMVYACGVYAGRPSWRSAGDGTNPCVYWEYRPLWDLAEEVGDLSAGRSWWEPTFPSLVVAAYERPDLAAKARRLIADMDCAGRRWVRNDPALCHLSYTCSPG
jgi:hypothetical protein